MKSLESTAFIGGFISAHYVKLYIKPLWKPSGSPTVKRWFRMRKIRASNSSSFCLHLCRSLPLSPCLPFSLRICLFFSCLGHSVLFLAENDQLYVWKWILQTEVMIQEMFPHHKKRKKSQAAYNFAAMLVLLFVYCVKIQLVVIDFNLKYWL